MLAPHPFGREITAGALIEKFTALKQWEDRYRQLIMLAKQLPPLPEALRAAEMELSGCENRVWLMATAKDASYAACWRCY